MTQGTGGLSPKRCVFPKQCVLVLSHPQSRLRRGLECKKFSWEVIPRNGRREGSHSDSQGATKGVLPGQLSVVPGVPSNDQFSQWKMGSRWPTLHPLLVEGGFWEHCTLGQLWSVPCSLGLFRGSSGFHNVGVGHQDCGVDPGGSEVGDGWSPSTAASPLLNLRGG